MPTSNNVQNSRKQIQFENKTAVPEISKKIIGQECIYNTQFIN